ncbi:hypothetical protein WJR50_12305 [Catalinimonas sp. 4WD22]|uniref:hypothetical protein n=1 Tax=Catalinimonas locisalis TaxID=3133978 RepID=UPI003101B0FF
MLTLIMLIAIMKFSLGLPWYMLLVVTILLHRLLYKAFYSSRWFRYLFALSFSIFWGVLAASFVSRLDSEGVFSVSFIGIFTFLFSLFSHKKQFAFYSKADLIIYQR